jgi:TIR domain
VVKKQFDLFVSYSHADRTIVESIAMMLRRRHVRIWLDGWEMKPGDILRDKISFGIANASFFLVVLSQSALSSRWVKYELNSGMIDEIERGNVRVIPAIAGKVEFADLPADLRAKYCLDLRTAESAERAVDAIVDLVRPEARRRKELIHLLRNPQDHSPETIAFMSEYAQGHRDQTIQVAALRGLARTPGPQATVAIAGRALDTWGCRGIETAFKILSKRQADGGLLALSAILPQDSRYFDQKLTLIISMIANDDPALASSFIEVQDPDYYHDRHRWAESMTALGDSNIPDLKNGIRLALSVPVPFGFYERPPSPSREEISYAEQYAEEVVPGFVNVLHVSTEKYIRERQLLAAQTTNPKTWPT